MKLAMKFEGAKVKNVKDEIEGPEDDKKPVLQLHLTGDTSKDCLPALLGCFEGQDVDYLYHRSSDDSSHLIPRIPNLSTMYVNGVHDECTVKILKDTFEGCRVQDSKVTLLEAGRARINFHLTITKFSAKQCMTLLAMKGTTLEIAISGGIALFEEEKPKDKKQKKMDFGADGEEIINQEELTAEEQAELNENAVTRFEESLQ